ncbi:hypothetical protein [Actinomyces mediterranea]|uniref:hypothetical protein n=1 Tax=Actinomyces mediterranea TaxID=1871028 RepID=UPI00101AED52|nr:hypothetical protein [Actinomyces mediterranea]
MALTALNLIRNPEGARQALEELASVLLDAQDSQGSQWAVETMKAVKTLEQLRGWRELRNFRSRYLHAQRGTFGTLCDYIPNNKEVAQRLEFTREHLSRYF